MSNPDRVVKVGQTWKFYGLMPKRMVRGKVVSVQVCGPLAPMYGFADLRENGGNVVRMYLHKDGTCLGDAWVRVSHPKPKVTRTPLEADSRDLLSVAERKRIAIEMLTAICKLIRDGAK